MREQSNGTSKVSGLYYLAGASQISWPQHWVCNLSILKEGKIEVLGLPVSKVYFNYNALMVEMLMFNIWSRIGFRPWGKWKIFSSTHVVNIFLITDLWWLARSQAHICKSSSSIPAVCLNLSLSLVRNKACETLEFCVLLPDASHGSHLLLVSNRSF